MALSRKEEVLSALAALLPIPAEGQKERNLAEDIVLQRGGLVVLMDGAAGEPEVILGNLRYIHTRVAELIVTAAGDEATRRLTVDALIKSASDNIAANRRLGGLADWVEPGTSEDTDNQPVDTNGNAVGPPVRISRMPIQIIYESLSPMG